MKWVTRARPKTDRVGCPLLIKRFIDPDAETLYVPTEQVLEIAEREGGHSFDAESAEFTHRDGKCTFEVLAEAFALTSDPGVQRLARTVHAADIKGELATDPLAVGLLAIAHGALEVEADDYRLLDRESFVYDAPYAWARSNPDQVTP